MTTRAVSKIVENWVMEQAERNDFEDEKETGFDPYSFFVQCDRKIGGLRRLSSRRL